MTPRRDSKWWGWGDPAIEPQLDEAARATLREWVGELEPAPRARSLDGFELPDARPLPAALAEAVGPEGVFTSVEDRLRHATGGGYLDLVRLRSGGLEAAPDAVLLPDTALHTVAFLDDLEVAVGKTVLTANQVTTWEALRLAGALQPQEGLGRLFRVGAEEYARAR